METSAGFWLLAVLLVAALSFTQAQTETSYFKAGGEFRLSPVPVSEEITGIVWKYDKFLLAEWVKDVIDLTYYSKFKGRSELNTATGVLVIQRMTAEDTALYSVEINNRVQSLVYQAVGIEEVPQPTVGVQPLACNQTQTCGLKSNGEIAKAEPVSYFKAGGELQLSPVPVSEEITSIVWKYDKFLLAEWVKDVIPLTYYSRFRGRSELNTTTGVLVIQRMTAEDTALYSVEINNRVQSLVYQAVGIEEVPQPTVDLQPLACNRLQTCGLKCYGETAKAEPVSYFWRNDDGEWESSGDRKELSREEMDDVETFSCRMKNPVSQKDSEPFKNPFYQEKEREPEGNPGAGV